MACLRWYALEALGGLDVRYVNAGVDMSVGHFVHRPCHFDCSPRNPKFMEVVCDRGVVACVNYHSVVPALKSIANRAYSDF